MASEPSTKPKSGLSLYANLLDPSSKDASTPGTISRAPVVFKQPPDEAAQGSDEAAQKQKINAAALRFQPTKRPQNAVQKQAQKIAQAKAAAINASLATSATTAPSSTAPDAKEQSQRPSAKTTIADWIGDADDDEAELFGGEKRRKGGRKKRKKNKQEASVAQDWDDIYDPTRPNNYEEYKHSDEKIREVREWKDRLYAHRMARRNDLSDSEDEDRRPQMSNKFAPPSMSFAPPPIDQEPPPSSADVLNDTAGEGAYEEQYQPPPPPPMEVPDDASGEDAYARRMRLSQLQSGIPAAPLTEPPPPPPPPEEPVPSQNLNFQRSAIDASSTVARAPVRYNLPPAPAELPKSEEELEAALQEDAEQQDDSAKDVPRSSRPGQRGFAERLMSKYGWTKGSGLGANSSGIINPLRVQVEKQKKKPDSEGGGFVGPGGRGKIIGGKKKGGEEDHGKFGPMSDVVILKDMLNGMDIDHELGEGNLMQEIGEECGEKYGRVERVYIDRDGVSNAVVFIKFTNQLSALRAVNALESRVFNGNKITARFYDSDAFERGIYR